jgi:rubrerythrin/CheY-like chemotaxis protein
MGRILLIDTVGDCRETIQQALEAAGFTVVVETALSRHNAPSDAIVLATDAVGLAQALPNVEAVRETAGTPVILVVDLDHSGWDRTFSAPEALSADALLDKPVDVHALLQRVKGILEARHGTRATAEAADMEVILDRAIANEEAAAAFYRHAAGLADVPETREALEWLARDEDEHKCLIEEFRSGARPLPKSTTSGGSLVEAFGAPAFSTELAPADAFLLAAQKERLAVKFYEDWAALYPEGDERDLLLRLAEVERRHKERVEALFANAAFPEAW